MINSIHENIEVPKDIVNLVEDVKYLLSHLRDSKVEYCSRLTNRDTDVLAKNGHL